MAYDLSLSQMRAWKEVLRVGVPPWKSHCPLFPHVLLTCFSAEGDFRVRGNKGPKLCLPLATAAEVSLHRHPKRSWCTPKMGTMES